MNYRNFGINIISSAINSVCYKAIKKIGLKLSGVNTERFTIFEKSFLDISLNEYYSFTVGIPVIKKFVQDNFFEAPSIQQYCTMAEFEHSNEIYYIQYDLKNTVSPTRVNNTENLFESFLSCKKMMDVQEIDNITDKKSSVDDYFAYNATFTERVSYIVPLAVMKATAITIIQKSIPVMNVFSVTAMFLNNPIIFEATVRGFVIEPVATYFLKRAYQDKISHIIFNNEQSKPEDFCIMPKFEYNNNTYYLKYYFRDTFPPTNVGDLETLYEKQMDCMGAIEENQVN